MIVKIMSFWIMNKSRHVHLFIIIIKNIYCFNDCDKSVVMGLIKNIDLIDCWFLGPVNNKIFHLTEFIKDKIGDRYYDEQKLNTNIKLFNSYMEKYWKLSKYNKEFFKLKYSKWLNWTFFEYDEVSFLELIVKMLSSSFNAYTK